MENKELMPFIDHTILKPGTTWEQIHTLCQESLKYGTASVCVSPDFVKKIQEQYGSQVNICTVIGFPLGYSTTEVKVFEARDAIENGASEIDAVININWVKEKKFDKIEEEIVRLRAVTEKVTLKIIIETCYLSEEEKIELCSIITRTKADYIKTSTGFGTGGATLEDISLFKKHIGPSVKIKASGGIRTKEAMEAYVEAGCSRIGTSSLAVLL